MRVGKGGGAGCGARLGRGARGAGLCAVAHATLILLCWRSTAWLGLGLGLGLGSGLVKPIIDPDPDPNPEPDPNPSPNQACCGMSSTPCAKSHASPFLQ